MERNPASFRDPSGYVLEDEKFVYRVIRPSYREEWCAFGESDLPAAAAQKGLLAFEEMPRSAWPAGIDTDAVAVLRSQKLPFISYPYEWCFSQLKDAAALTLDLQLEALKRGFVLKDATAYNVQFLNGKPVFIDLLSFERLREGRPWDAYGQFCAHFLAPLALMALRDVRLGLLSRQWIDGIPLDLASRLLPARSKFSPGLAMHLHMHASMRTRHAETGRESREGKTARLNVRQLEDVADSLRRTVQGLKNPSQQTEWGDYYNDTNYTAAAREAKERIVAEVAREHPGRLAVDLGANNGLFSRLMSPFFEMVLATDADHEAVDRHWREERNPNVLPLVLDLASPSPALGWACEERQSFAQRCRADLVSALALIHHLRITAGIPFERMAAGIGMLIRGGGTLLVEFVPKDDSQVQRLLSRRDDAFGDYTLENFIDAFEKAGLRHEDKRPMPETGRTMHLFKKL